MLISKCTRKKTSAEESENSPESPHLGEIKRMRKQCIPAFFARAGDEANAEAERRRVKSNIQAIITIYLFVYRYCFNMIKPTHKKNVYILQTVHIPLAS